jgi:hypothetical protein
LGKLGLNSVGGELQSGVLVFFCTRNDKQKLQHCHHHLFVIPAKAGIQRSALNVDSRFRIVRRTRRTLGNDSVQNIKSSVTEYQYELAERRPVH